MKKLGLWMAVLLLILSIFPLGAAAAEADGVAIPVQVTAEGPEPEGNRYTVVLEGLTPECPMPKDSRLVLEAGERGYFRFSCEKLGIFDYSIRQLPGTETNCTYDSRSYLLRLYVTAGEDGTPEGTALLYGQEGVKETAVLLGNRWSQPASVTVTAWKTMDGNTPEDGRFTFRLLSENGEVLYEVQNRGSRVRFPELTFDTEGTWRFYLKEVAGKEGKVLYDRTVYTLTVTVTKDTDYRARIAWERNGKPWSGTTPSFANYTDTGSPKTGDSIGRWVAALGASSAGLVTLAVVKKRKPRV